VGLAWGYSRPVALARVWAQKQGVKAVLKGVEQ